MAQVVKNLPAMQETWVQSLGWEDTLKKEMLPTLVFWPGEFHGLYSPCGHKESDTIKQLSLSIFYRIDISHDFPYSFIGCLIVELFPLLAIMLL